MMTTKELEQAILDLFIKLYCKQYIGLLKVSEILNNKDYVIGYKVDIGLNKDEKPLSIAYEGSDLEFLSFIEKELKKRDLSRVEYFTAIQIYKEDECRKKC